MTDRHDLDRDVLDWLVEQRPAVAPAHVLEGVRVEIATTGRRPGWRIADRWTWRHQAALRTALRVGVVLAVLASLVAIAVAGISLLGPHKPAPPFGLTRAGLIAIDTKDGIVVTDADGTNRVLMTSGEGRDVSPTWSRDGLRLAFWHRAVTNGPWSLVVIDADGSGRQVLADAVHLRAREDSFNQPSNISWSPDSRRIAYAADVGGGSSVFIATLGSSAIQQITDPKLQALDLAWSPTGQVIAFESDASQTLHVVGIDGSGEHRLSSLTQTALWPDWAPDGTRLAVAAANGDSTDIWLVSADGAEIRNISSDPTVEFDPAWSPDGRRLAWARMPADESIRAWVVVADVDLPRVIEIRVEADLAPPVWSPDGTRLYSYGMAPDGSFNEVIVLDPNGVAPVVRLPSEGSIGNSNWQRLP
jgi:Tol biopolymer transport system component